MEKITSRDNNRLKKVRRVRDGKLGDLIFIEGVRLAEEAVRSGLPITEAFFAEDFAATADEGLPEEMRRAGVPSFELPSRLFRTISDTKNPQGVVLIAERPTGGRTALEERLDASRGRSLTVLLHGISNPSNLGAILRTAEAAGAHGVITTDTSAGVYTPRSLRGSMGSAFRLPVWENAGFGEVLGWAKGRHLRTVGADTGGEVSYRDLDWNDGWLIVFGSEAHGLSFSERESLETSVRIPMRNGVESLNLAVSCGIILFEAGRDL